MCVMPLSTFSIKVTLHGLLRTPGNLELRNLKRRGTPRLAFIVVGIVGLVRDIDAGHMCCCSHFCLLTMRATFSPSLSIPIAKNLIRAEKEHLKKCIL